ncbi:MAG: SRPBCC family protein [Ignavibacteriales bacterium]
MKIYKLHFTQTFTTSLDVIWEFLSTPKNLDEITPKELRFKILSDLPEKMYSGQIITYQIKVLPFVSYTWVTEIKNVVEKEYFIDEQRFGPYKFWHHQHRLELNDGKVIMHDIIHYALPFGILGILMNFIFIQEKLKKIFSYRKSYLDKKFNSK